MVITFSANSAKNKRRFLVSSWAGFEISEGAAPPFTSSPWVSYQRDITRRRGESPLSGSEAHGDAVFLSEPGIPAAVFGKLLEKERSPLE